RGGRQLERRPTPTPGDRPRAGGTADSPGARRGDERPRSDHREPDRRCAAAARVHPPDRRPSAEHDPGRRRDHRDGARQGRATRYPRRAESARRALCPSDQRGVNVMEPRGHATAAEGDELQLAGNAPLSLDAARQLWLVEEGRAEVFAVPRHGSGSRIHLWTATAGQMLCGFAPLDGDGLGLLAVGHPGTRLRRLPEAKLRELLRDPAAAAELAGRLDDWLSGLFAEITRTAAPKVF